MSVQFVRTLYNFASSEPNEISLQEGDIVQILQQVDNNWLCGKLNGRVGNFPSNFVQPITVPTISAGEKVFAAIKNFRKQEDGDLAFNRGDLIVGLEAVDQNWWQGQVGHRFGIFPLTHASELEIQPPGEQHRQPDLPPRPSPSERNHGSPHQHTAPAQSPVPTQSTAPAQSPAPALSPAHSPAPTQSPVQTAPASLQTDVLARARATMDLTAQLHDELGFMKGDIIHVLQVTDSDFGIGRCGEKTGSFPFAFVEVIEGDLNLDNVPKEKRRSKFRWWEEEEEGADCCKAVNSAAQDSVSNTTDVQPSTTETMNAQNILRTDPGRVSQEDANILSHRRTGSYTQANTRSYDAELQAYGKTLFPFISENENELTFFDNEIITLIRHVDDQWMEGEINGKRGIFPTSYVEIIVDCLYPEEVAPSSGEGTQETVTSLPMVEASATGEPEGEEFYGRVLYDFQAESEQDLALSEGDTVTILRQMDDDWYQARHDDGRIGLCPVTFIEVIGSEPVSLSSMPSMPSMSDSTAEQTVLPSEEPQVAPPSEAAPPKLAPPSELQGNESPREIPAEPSTCVTNTVSPKPAVKPPKPQLKPKPALKPKPTVKQRSLDCKLSEESNNNNNKLNPDPQRAPNTRSLSVSDTARPPPEPAPRGPTFNQQFISKGTSLDDVIKSELHIAKADAENRSRSSSVRSESSSGDSGSPRVVIYHESASTVFKSSGSTPSPTTLQPQAPHSVGMSLFYSQSSASGSPKPARPPPRSGKKPPPPRPAGPRPASVPSSTPLIPAAGKVDYGPSPVPHRAAPPRPVRTPGEGKKSGADLMDFSPEKTASPMFESMDPNNAEVTSDLEDRIQEVQRDLDNYNQTKEELKRWLKEADDADKVDIQENLDFCEANILGLAEELCQLKANLYQMHPQRLQVERESKKRAAVQLRLVEEERRAQHETQQHQESILKQRREQREKVIEEILKTETDFLQGLSLCIATFLGPDSEKCATVDMETLFGNMDEVMDVSQKLLNLLEEATSGKTFEEQALGNCFVKLKEEMKNVYRIYCRNHDDVLALLEKYETDEEIQEYFGRLLDIYRDQMGAFDLGSILIKPVQRILKYPLLLNELIKCTDDDHVDKAQLPEAMRGMTDVAAAINEYKRRKDLVLKYKKDTDERFSDKIAKLNVHSTKKKFYRLSQKMVGIQTVDELFNQEEKKFKCLDAAVRCLVRDIAIYVEQLETTVAIQEALAADIADYYGDSRSQQIEVEQNGIVCNKVAMHIVKDFKSMVEKQVIQPLNRLLLMFQGPNKVMKKRYDKLLDYDNINTRVKNIKESEILKSDKEELRMSKNNYEALNAQLLDELPRLYTLSVDVVQECLAQLIHAQQWFYNTTLQEMYQLLGLPLVLSSGDAGIIETFNITHTVAVEHLSELSFIPKTFNPNVEEKKKSVKARKSLEPKTSSPLSQSKMPQGNAVVSQSDSHKMYLRGKYSADKLFIATCDVAESQMMDLALVKGTLVGVVKEGDPMGNKQRWFVDNGVAKGFVMKTNLMAAHDVDTTPDGACAAQDLLVLNELPPSQARKSPLPADLEWLDTEPTSNSTWYSSPKSPLDQSQNTSEVETRNSQWYLPTDVGSSQSEKALEAASSAAAAAAAAETPSELLQDLPPEYSKNHVEGGNEYYQAVYAFTARNEIEVNLQEGQMVRVLERHDQDGNTEWWLVEVHDGQGYAPANYLYKIQ